MDPFRRGGFGSISLTGGFSVGTTGFGQYDIGGAADEQAYLAKYQAQTDWNNGLITNDEYLDALRRYVASTSKGTSQRISAQNELDDAVYTIGRNEIIHQLNGITASGARLALWRRLIRYDRSRMGTMERDNEQRAELADRIADEEASFRREGWGALVRRFNRDQVSSGQMLTAARRLAGISRGGVDALEWADQVTTWEGRVLDEQQAAFVDDYQNAESTERGAAGRALLSFLDGRMGGMDRESPAYLSLARQHAQYDRVITADRRAQEEQAMDRRRAAGDVTDDAYLAWWSQRYARAVGGTDEKRRLRARLTSVAFDVAERRGQASFDATGDPTALIDVYRGRQVTMEPGSALYGELDLRIADLRARAYGTFSLSDQALPGGGVSGGHYVDIVGLGTPTDAQGFASQYDGSAFASSNCGMAVAAMLAWSAGVEGLSGGEMRWYSGDREGGTGLDGIGTALGAVGRGLSSHEGMSIAAFRRRIAGGQTAALLGDAQVLGTIDHLSPHWILVDRAKKVDGQWAYWIKDPTGRAGYDGQWISESQLYDYGWSGRPSHSGQPMFGDAGFVTANPGSNKAITVHGEPPFQAFDTDAQGRSTLGRGGGNSRREAGYMPPGFRQGRREGGRVSVDEFLGAVTRMTGGAAAIASMEEAGLGEAAQRARAARLLDRYDGDAGRAAVEWITGVAPEEILSRSERHIARAVREAVRTDIEGGIGSEVGEPPEPGAEEPGDAGTQVARRFLRAIGAPDTDANRRAVQALIVTENGGREGLDPLNPFDLRTKGVHDLPGQVGARDGRAIFDSPAAAIDAAAVDMLRRFPSVVAGFRGSDPAMVARALTGSGYDDSALAGNAFIHQYNQLPGDVLVAGGVLADTPASFSDSAKQAPQVAGLFDIDPTDSVQRMWYDANYAAVRAAMTAGADRWTFTYPDMVTVVSLPFDPALAVEMADDRYVQTERLVSLARSTGDVQLINDAMVDQREQIGDLSEVTMEGATRVRDGIMAQAETALAQGDAFGAYQLKLAWQAFLGNEVLGSGDVPDVTRTRNAFLMADTDESRAALAQAREWIDEDANDPLLVLRQGRGDEAGFTGEGGINPDLGFLSQEWDARSMRFEVRVHDFAHEPDAFITQTVTDEYGRTTEVPVYKAAGGRVPVALPTGTVVWQMAEQTPSAIDFDAYVPQPVSVAETVSTVALWLQDLRDRGALQNPMVPGPGGTTVEFRDFWAGLPSAGAGPTEPRRAPIGIEGVTRIVTADPFSQVQGQKRLYWYNLPGSPVWIGAPEGELPELTATTGTWKRTPEGWTVDDKKLTPALYSQVFTWVGLDGKTINGQDGIGGVDKDYVVRVQGVDGGFDTTLSAQEGYHLGGEFWDPAASFVPHILRNIGLGPRPAAADTERAETQRSIRAGYALQPPTLPPVATERAEALRDIRAGYADQEPSARPNSRNLLTNLFTFTRSITRPYADAAAATASAAAARASAARVAAARVAAVRAAAARAQQAAVARAAVAASVAAQARLAPSVPRVTPVLSASGLGAGASRPPASTGLLDRRPESMTGGVGGGSGMPPVDIGPPPRPPE